jgi:hypothetical protein
MYINVFDVTSVTVRVNTDPKPRLVVRIENIDGRVADFSLRIDEKAEINPALIGDVVRITKE